MSVRVLQRHLTARALTFEALLDANRRDVVACLVAETTTKVLDVAFDLGYSDQATSLVPFCDGPASHLPDTARRIRSRAGPVPAREWTTG